MGEAFQGHYYDGRSADRRRATVTVGGEGLAIALDTGATVLWPFAEVRQTQGQNPGEPLRLERGAPLPEILVLADRGILAALGRAAPAMRRRLSAPPTAGRRTAIVLSALAGTFAAAAVLYLWVIPFGVTIVARYIPIAWEEEIGRAVTADLERVCEAPEGRAALDRLTETLLAASPGAGYTYRVQVVDVPAVNAFAAPGGYIVIFRGLITRVERPEELAGVLAHEIQHIEQRHTTTMLLREVSAGALLTAATGDATQLAQVLAAARVFGRLHFGREAERSADEGGMRMIQAARIDARGMASFMRKVASEEGKGEEPRELEYLRTHPKSRDRAADLDRLAEAAAYEPIALLTDAEWQALRGICRTGAGEAPPAPGPE